MGATGTPITTPSIDADTIAKLRRMVAESTADPYTDTLIEAAISDRAVTDDRGLDPYWFDSSTEPPTRTQQDNWIPTYDLNAAAADIWDEKAAAVGCNYDFSADGSNLKRSQLTKHYESRAAHFRARARIGSVELQTVERYRDQNGTIFQETRIFPSLELESQGNAN